MKRVFDLIVAFFGLILLFPIFLTLVSLLKFKSKGSVFFVQERVGRDAVLFNIIKFRSMNQIKGMHSTISVKGDVRITRVGSILRKYKLDELPALFNVLKGDMSLVGPRPDVPGYADKLEGEYRKILELRPGITSEASLKYHNEEEILSKQENPIEYNDTVIYPDKVQLNLDYYYNHNLWVDIKIIFATIFKIFY